VRGLRAGTADLPPFRDRMLQLIARDQSDVGTFTIGSTNASLTSERSRSVARRDALAIR